MEIKIKDKNGITLKTKGKYITEDINITVGENSTSEIMLLSVPSTTDANATSEDIRVGKTAYVNDEKIIGNIETYKGEQENGITFENSLKRLLDYTKSTTNLCANSDITEFTYTFNNNELENVTDMYAMFNNCKSLTTIKLFDTSKVTKMNHMFGGCSSLTTVPQLDTSNVTDMSNMFSGCSSLTTIPQLNTSNVTDMSMMFYSCPSLTSIPQLDTSNVTDMYAMFNNCKSLTSIPQLDTSNVTNMSDMFSQCYALTKIDLTYYNGYATNFFHSCYSLKTIIIRSFGEKYTITSGSFSQCYHLSGAVNSIYNPDGLKDGYIYVPRNMVDTLKTTEVWSTYASQIRALEDYTIDGTTTGELDESKVNA